jgi:hypothetical protein
MRNVGVPRFGKYLRRAHSDFGGIWLQSPPERNCAAKPTLAA